MDDVLREFLEWYADIIADQPSNNELLRFIRETGIRDPTVLEEKLGAREVEALLCYINGQYEYSSIAGFFGFVDAGYIIYRCVADNGKPVAMIHNHPGGAAVPSLGDVRELRRLVIENKLDIEYYCIARRGDEGVVITCIRVPRDAEKLENLEYISNEALTVYLNYYDGEDLDVYESDIPIPAATSVVDEDTARDYEKLFQYYAEDDGFNVETLVIKI